MLLWLCSGNLMGDIGARMLSKALQINKKLRVIHWDHNNTSPNGFHDIATALEKYASSCSLPAACGSGKYTRIRQPQSCYLQYTHTLKTDRKRVLRLRPKTEPPPKVKVHFQPKTKRKQNFSAVFGRKRNYVFSVKLLKISGFY